MVSAVRSVAPAANTSLAVQSARREAQQAEQTARALQSQAQAAQRSADQEQARADDLSTQSASADQRANRARGSLAAATDAASRPPPRPGVTLASPPSDPHAAQGRRTRGRGLQHGALRQRVCLIA